MAIYIHAPVSASVDGMNPAGCVTAGRAKMPAPTVVPATRTIAFLGDLDLDLEPKTREIEMNFPNDAIHLHVIEYLYIYVCVIIYVCVNGI